MTLLVKKIVFWYFGSSFYFFENIFWHNAAKIWGSENHLKPIYRNNEKVCKKMIFIQSCLCMAMQGCDLILRVGARKSIYRHFQSAQKNLKFWYTYNFLRTHVLERGLFFRHRGDFWELISGDFQSPEKAQNSGRVYFQFIQIFLKWRCWLDSS